MTHTASRMSRRRGRYWVALVVALAACAPALPRPSAADTSIAQRRWPSATLPTLEQGRALYVRRCAGCHSLKDPKAIPAEAWPDKIAKMRHDHDVRLASDEAELIAEYLYTMGRRAD